MSTGNILKVISGLIDGEVDDRHKLLKAKCKTAVAMMERAQRERQEALQSVEPLKKQCRDKQRQIDVLRADLKRKNDDLTTQRKAYDMELKEQGEKLRRLKDGPRYE